MAIKERCLIVSILLQEQQVLQQLQFLLARLFLFIINDPFFRYHINPNL
jgi:hypothetical protein